MKKMGKVSDFLFKKKWRKYKTLFCKKKNGMDILGLGNIWQKNDIFYFLRAIISHIKSYSRKHII